MMTDKYVSRQSNVAQLSKRQDPVCYGTWQPSAPITQDQAQQFDCQGFLVMENILTLEELKTLQTAAEQALGQNQQFKPETVITEPGSNATRSIFEIHQQSPVMQRLAADSRLAGVVSFLLDDQVYVHQSRLNYKPGFKGQPFYWHSDFETWHTEDGMPAMRAISASVILTDNNADNGPLMLIPGSHLQFLSCVGNTPDNHYKQSLKKQEYGVPDDAHLAAMFNENGIISITAKAGSVIFFDCNIMHGSNSNITPLPRSNAFFVYNAISNQLTTPFSAGNPRPTFIACRTPQVIQPIYGPIGD